MLGGWFRLISWECGGGGSCDGWWMGLAGEYGLISMFRRMNESV